MKPGFHHRPTWVEIDLDRVAHNFNQIKRHVGNKKIMGVVKADAYGHGSVEVAHLLIDHGVDYLAVAILDEALVLRNAGITHPILILGYTPKEQVEDIVRLDIAQTVYHRDLIIALNQEGKRQNKGVKIHIKVDTGMGRIGFRETREIIEVVKTIQGLPYIIPEGIFTHFSTADQRDKGYTQRQLACFHAILKELEEKDLPIPVKHCANSAAILDLSQTHLDLVRPGIILYGLYPSEEVCKETIELRPAMSFKTRVAHIKTVPADTSISYGRKFISKEDTVIATLPVGYADGYSRMLTGKAQVLIKGMKVPVVGSVCMDQCMIDVSNVPNVDIGDEVVLFGEGLPVEELARQLGTINYEIPCMINKRVPRIFKKDHQISKSANE